MESLLSFAGSVLDKLNDLTLFVVTEFVLHLSIESGLWTNNVHACLYVVSLRPWSKLLSSDDDLFNIPLGSSKDSLTWDAAQFSIKSTLYWDLFERRLIDKQRSLTFVDLRVVKEVLGG